MKIKDSVLIISPLVAGFLVYFSCRTKNLVYYHWLPFKGYVGLDSLHFMVNEKCREILIGTVGGDITVYSIPGALYAFSLTYYLKLSCFKNTYVLRPTRFGRIIFCLALIFLVSVLPELFQFYGLLPGYFDVLDVLHEVNPELSVKLHTAFGISGVAKLRARLPDASKNNNSKQNSNIPQTIQN